MPISNPTPPELSPQQIKRFNRYAAKGAPDECWIWRGPIFQKSGRGRVTTGPSSIGRKCQAHKVAYYLATGIWTLDCVCHTCDVPLCVNPNHLFDGTHADNNHDRQTKGRSAIGSSHGRVKLKAEDIPTIRALHKSGYSYGEIGRRYLVDAATIRDAVVRRSWNWIP